MGGFDEYELIYEHDEKDSKQMKLKDIFDIALTTLAFLSFGMFILHVLMCITMTKNDNNMMMMPMEEGEMDDGGTNGGTIEVRRRRRSPKSPGPTITELNEITRKVLQSIEAVLISNTDRGSCLHRSLCENNSYTRRYRHNDLNMDNHNNDTKLWMPVWGLGLTWLSSKLIRTQTAVTSMLESLRASISGIGGADCIKLYPNCDERIFIVERRKMRKRRQTEIYALRLDF